MVMQKIGDVCEVNEKSISAKDKKKHSHFHYLDLTNLTENKIDTIEKIESDKLPSRAKRIVRKNDVIISTVRPIQRHNGILTDFPENLLVSTGYTVLTVDEAKANPHYLYYYISNQVSQKRMELIARTSTSSYPSLRPDDISELKYTKKSLNYQNEVGEILRSIDEKMKLNKNELNSLEEYTQLLFYKWFIDFNFPNKNGEPYKDSGGKMVDVDGKLIPAGWDYRTLKGDFEIENGISYTSKSIASGEGIPMINLGSFSLDGEYLHDNLLYYSENYQESKIISSNDLVVACTDLTRNADIIGQSFLVPESFEDKYLLSMDAVCIRINDDSTLTNEFLNYLYKQSHYREFIKRYANGTNVLHLAKRGLYRFKTLIPNSELIQHFTKVAKITHKKKSLLMKENLLLSETKDLLIQKLIK